MKDSGVEWIGQIPLDWDVCKLKYLIGIKSGDAIRNEDISSDGLYQVFGGGEVIGYTNKQNANEKNLLIGRVGARCGCVTKPLNKVYATDNALVVFTKENRNYFYDVLVSADLNKLNSSNAQPLLTATKIKNVFVPHPSLAEQQRIADFLDEKCGEIDSIRSDVQREIEILNNYKKSVITEAVTKGLNTKAKLKDSGIEWIGKIPEEWNIHPLYYYFDERKHKNILGKERNLLSLSYGKIIRKDIDCREGLLPENFNGYNIIEQNDIVLRLTDLQNDKRSLRTGLVKEHGIITSAYVTLKACCDLNQSYFHYLLHSYDAMKVLYNMGNGVRQGLNYSELAKMLLVEPPLSEQKAIADYLDEKCSAIDATIADKQKQLETLDEYKKSLIFEYVTGKKEVLQ